MNRLAAVLLGMALVASRLHAAEPERVDTFGPGIAASYAADRGIEADPRVILVESFEETNVPEMLTHWEAVGGEDSMSLSDDVPEGSGGRQSLLMARESGPGPSMYRRLKNDRGGWGYDRVFARYYVRFAEDCGEIHHFGTCLGGSNPAVPWPAVKAGMPTDGAKSFWSGIEPFGSSWTWDYYTYWQDMRGSPPRGQTWGNSFVHDPDLKVKRGEWICVEQMIQMNDVGESNGEQALWIDGKLISHLRPGAPSGLWVFDKFMPGRGGEGVRWNHEKGDRESFTVPAEGAPFEGFRWRSVPELNVNYVWLYVYTQKPAGHRLRVWFDDVVVATEYIGPSAK